MMSYYIKYSRINEEKDIPLDIKRKKGKLIEYIKSQKKKIK